MNNDIKELMSGILKDMSALNYIKPGDVPNINLYMDQVTTFMYEHRECMGKRQHVRT